MKAIFKLIVLSSFFTFSAKAQLHFPQFNYSDSFYKAGSNLTRYLKNYYSANQTLFDNYGGSSYHLATFKVTKWGQISSIIFDSDTSVATRFITNALKASAKRWDFTNSTKGESWNFILPFYFLFPEAGATESTKIPFKTYYPEWPGYKGNTIKDTNGYSYQEVRGDTVILWPVEFMGIMESKKPGPRPVDLRIETKE